jgi:hypothetical protein
MARGARTRRSDLERLKRIEPWDWPADTGPRLLAILTDPSASKSDRLVAAELGGDFTIVDDDLALALLAIVEDASASEELRCRAAISLGPALDDANTAGFDALGQDDVDPLISEATFRRVRRSLHALHGDPDAPPEVRRSVLEASVRSPEDWHADAVRAAYSNQEPPWVVTAVFCMRFVPGFGHEILEALQSDDLDIQYQAVCAAGNWALDGAWSQLAALATDEEATILLRLAAIEGLGLTRASESAEVLFELTESTNEEIADAAWEALGTAQLLADDVDEGDEDAGRGGEVVH